MGDFKERKSIRKVKCHFSIFLLTAQQRQSTMP